MSERSSIVQTVCVQTRDAERPSDGVFVFQTPGDMPRVKAVRLMLGSLEFPMVQWTIEQEWSRFYFNEGVRLTPTCNTLAFSDARGGASVVVGLPPNANAIKKWRRGAANGMELAIAECEHPHRMWDAAGRPVRTFWPHAECTIVGGPFSALQLSTLARDGHMVPVSATEFGIRAELLSGDGLAEMVSLSEPRAGVVHTPDAPSMAALCLALEAALNAALSPARVWMRYDATENRVELEVDSGARPLTLLRTDLSVILGLGAFDRPLKAENGMVAISTEPVRFWSAVELTPGWYGPCSRSMCTGPPRMLANELEMALNRLHFPVSERVPQGASTPHFLVFVEPAGRVCTCPVPIGRYTPASFTSLLSRGMTLASRETCPNVVFVVEYRENRFSFSCHVKTPLGEHPAPFSLLFSHPLQFDPERIGFSALVYSGSAVYVAPRRAVLPERRLSNIYRVSEIGAERRFRFHATGPPLVSGVIRGYNVGKARLKLQIYLGKYPCVHGYEEGDVVQLSVAPRETAVLNEQGEEQSVRACELVADWPRTAMVLPPKDDDPPTLLRLRTRPAPALRECVGQCLGVWGSTAPFNMCTGPSLPRSIHPHLLGLWPGATQWGVDGSIGPHRTPPFDAPNVHNLDHVDYVCVYLDEGKRSTQIHHASGNSTSTPFTKLVLYPMFREERMIPRDVNLISGESLSRFTLRFTNPDGTPYHFHGAQFSLTLNLVRSLE